jgi:hypothetical protein
MIVGAPFAGALEIIVYAGAIMVLFVFVVMMLNLGQHTVEQERKWLTSSAWAYPAFMSFLMGLVLVWMLGSDYTAAGPVMGTEVVGPKVVGKHSLLTIYYWLKLLPCYCLLRWLQHSILANVNQVQKRTNNNGQHPFRTWFDCCNHSFCTGFLRCDGATQSIIYVNEP